MTPAERALLNQRLVQLGTGDRTAAAPVFEALWPVVRSFCVKWLAGGPDAEDCAQLALVRVFSQAAAFDPTKDALAWALEIAVWECRTARRAQQRRRAAADHEVLGQTPDDGSTPFADVERAELEAALSEAVKALAPADAEEVMRLLREEWAGGPAARKRRQRALDRLKRLWWQFHGAVPR